MKKLYTILLLIVLSNSFFGQHSSLNSSYLLNIFSINPAYAGQRRALDITMFSRKQWLGTSGTPQTISLLGSLELKTKNLSIGWQIQNDNIGFTNTSTFKAAISYRIKTDKKGKLALGIMPGYKRLYYDYRKIITTSNADATFILNSPTVNSFITSAGAFYYTKKLYIGISSPQILNINGINSPIELNLISGYLFRVNKNVVLKPSCLVRWIKNSPPQFDLNLTSYFNEDFGVGLAYRNQEAIVCYFDWVINKKFKIAYAYDYSLGAIKRFNSGSHEIMLNYFFGKISTTPSPRSF